MKTKIVFSEKCLGYGSWHVEGPQRVKLAHEILKEKGYEFLEPARNFRRRFVESARS